MRKIPFEAISFERDSEWFNVLFVVKNWKHWKQLNSVLIGKIFKIIESLLNIIELIVDSSVSLFTKYYYSNTALIKIVVIEILV